MYCPNCSSEVKSDLHFCNSCGYRLESGTRQDAGNIAANVLRAVGFIGVVGFITFVFVIKLLLESGALQGAVIAVAFLYLAALFGICYSALSFVRSIYLGSEKKERKIVETPLEVSANNINRLEEARTPPASVTEHTTRTLEKLPVENK